ncbi:unknown [Prevotella sp. CAG:255]|nr:unknown [Prevotella sp. CAG:255]
MLTPYDTEPDRRQTTAGTETSIKAYGRKTAKSLGIRS